VIGEKKLSLMGDTLAKFGLMRDWYATFATLSKERRTGGLWYGALTEKNVEDHGSRILISFSRIMKISK